MDQEAIRRYIGAFDGVDVSIAKPGDDGPEIAWGDTFFIYDADRNLEGARRFPFATIVTKDYGDFDNASNLIRDGVFRLNIGVSKETFAQLFSVESDYNFTALDVLMPHPVYAQYHFVCVLNPSDATFDKLKPLIDEAYRIAVHRVQGRRVSRRGADAMPPSQSRSSRR